jgi:hypothetical protein
VSIAQLALARDKARGEVVALVNVDSPAGNDVLEKLRRLPSVERVVQARLQGRCAFWST